VTHRQVEIRAVVTTLAWRLAPALVVVAFVAAAAAAVHAQGSELRLAPSEVNWPAPTAGGVGTSGVSGIQTVVLKGDPSKPGLYTLLLRVGPNTKIQSHAHPDDRIATVLSGTWYFGYGREFNEGALKALPPGSVYTEPPNANHFAMTRGEGVVVQITGTGPSGTAYVDPANDPARGR
jgi:quercetin dioxygenase-like cupin family protein